MSIRRTLVLTVLLGCGATAPKTYHATDPSADNCSELFYMSGSVQRHPFVKEATFEKEIKRKCFLDIVERIGEDARRCTVSVHRSTEDAAAAFAAESRDNSPTPGGDRLVHRGEVTVVCRTMSTTPPKEFAEIDKEVDAYMTAFAPDAKVTDAYAGAKPQTAATATNAAAQLALAPMTLKSRGGPNAHLVVEADGTIVSVNDGNRKGAKLTPDGTLVNLETNAVAYRLASDGTFTSTEAYDHLKGKTFKITADGAFTDGTKSISFDANGLLDPENGPGWQIEGATTPALKRTAMFLVIAVMWPQHPLFAND